MNQNKMFFMNSFSNGYNINSFEHFDYKCHVVSYDFALLHPEIYSITAICPYEFDGFY